MSFCSLQNQIHNDICPSRVVNILILSAVMTSRDSESLLFSLAFDWRRWLWNLYGYNHSWWIKPVFNFAYFINTLSIHFDWAGLLLLLTLECSQMLIFQILQMMHWSYVSLFKLTTFEFVLKVWRCNRLVNSVGKINGLNLHPSM